MFSDVSKSTLLTNNGLDPVLGPLLGGPDRGVSLGSLVQFSACSTRALGSRMFPKTRINGLEG